MIKGKKKKEKKQEKENKLTRVVFKQIKSNKINVMFSHPINYDRRYTHVLIHVFFSLFSFADGEYMFVDPESKLSKYGPKSWRSSHTHVSSKQRNFLLFIGIPNMVNLKGLVPNQEPYYYNYLKSFWMI